ncbi:hypothetical protein, partial [Allorhizocola rhizosphaerae]|uniref:hypothetical protein n=1 Tax=Allorhizocola rhizosphaerae TaxID=1872709 RepID=UPI001B8AE2C7
SACPPGTVAGTSPSGRTVKNNPVTLLISNGGVGGGGGGGGGGDPRPPGRPSRPPGCPPICLPG